MARQSYANMKEITIIAGPCAVESKDQIEKTAEFLAKLGVKILRGGAFKPRTNPDDFQGLGEEGLKLLRAAADKFGMQVITEVMDPRDIEMVSKYADILQIGSRNMHNSPFLAELGKQKKPLLLKRGMSATLNEFLQAVRYIEKAGNKNILLCERGERTFHDETRFTLNLGSIPAIKSKSNYPLIVDPSHAAGNRDYVIAMAKGAIAAGADGLMIEVHPDPEKALCDGPQALTFTMFEQLMNEI